LGSPHEASKNKQIDKKMERPLHIMLENGGADRDRTDDLHNAIVALFQLSYGPQYDNSYKMW
jgi:hypothetical protein